MVSERKPDFWRNVKPNDNIIVGDELTRKERMAAGKGPTPESYRVSEIMIVRNSLAEWRLFCIEEAAGLYLMAKIVDKTFSLLLYKLADWNPVTRAEVIGTELDFIFQPPSEDQIDPEKGFIGDPNSLRYIGDLTHNEVQYLQKGQGEQNGNVSFNPPRSGVSNWRATLVEYACDEKVQTPEPETLLIEAGEPSNGVIKIFKGRPLKLNDVKVMQQ